MRLRGALIAVPIVNVPRLLNLSRYLPDRRDLNRSFPGLTKGSLAARLAKQRREARRSRLFRIAKDRVPQRVVQPRLPAWTAVAKMLCKVGVKTN